MTAKDPMAKELREMVRESIAGRHPHPSLDLLKLYLRQEIEEQDREVLRDHLAICEQCVEELLDLQAFLKSAAKSMAKADNGGCPAGAHGEEASSSECSTEEMERVWKSLRQSLGEDATASGFVLGGFWPQIGLSTHGIRRQLALILTTWLTTATLSLALWTPQGLPASIHRVYSSHLSAQDDFLDSPGRRRGRLADSLVDRGADRRPLGRLIDRFLWTVLEAPTNGRSTDSGRGPSLRGHKGRTDPASEPTVAMVHPRRVPYLRSPRTPCLPFDREPLLDGVYTLLFCGSPTQEQELWDDIRASPEE